MSKIQQNKSKQVSNQQFILNSYHNNLGRNSDQFHYMSGPIQQNKYSENKIRRKNNIFLEENDKIQSQSITHMRRKESVYRIPAKADYQRLQSKSTKETWYDMGEAEKMKDFELPCADDNDNTMTKIIDEKENKFEFLWEDIDTTTTSTTTTTTAPVTLQYKRKSRRGKSIKNQSTHSALNLFKQLSRKMKRPPKRVFNPLTKSTKSLYSRKPPATSTIPPLIQTTTTTTTRPSYASSSFVRSGSASSVYVSPPKVKKPSYVVDTGPGGVELLPSPSQMGETAYIKRNHYQSARFYPSRPHQTRHRNYTPRCSYSYIDPSHKCTNSYSNYGNHK